MVPGAVFAARCLQRAVLAELPPRRRADVLGCRGSVTWSRPNALPFYLPLSLQSISRVEWLT